MNREEALALWNELKEKMIAALPEDATMSKTSIEYSSMGSPGRKHIEFIYGAGFELGENFSGLVKYDEEPSYWTWLSGIERHLNEAIGIVREFNSNFSLDDLFY